MDMPRIGTRKLYLILKDDLASIGVGRDKLFEILKSNKMLMGVLNASFLTPNSILFIQLPFESYSYL